VNFTLHKVRSRNHFYHGKATVLSLGIADTSVAVSYVLNIKIFAMEAQQCVLCVVAADIVKHI
jgi:hypothetical protein